MPQRMAETPRANPSLHSHAFRELFLLRPGIVFLNHGAFGACPSPVFAAYQRWQRELERQPVEFLGRRFRNLLQEARQSLAEFVGAPADDLVYVPNATTGLNIVARSLGLGAGDEVLGTDHEYGAIDRTWQFLCARRGARYLRARLPSPVQSKEQIADAILAHVGPRTRVLSISHIASPTALVFPVELLVARAREAGILTVIDGAHAPGQVPLNLTALGADFYTGNCHKWMCAPKGSAFLYARREAQVLLRPLIVSWGSESEQPAASPFINDHEWQGTRDIAAYLAVPAAIQFLREHQWSTVQADCHRLAQAARRAIEGLSRFPGLYPDDPAWYAQMVSIPVPVADAPAAQSRLYDEFGIEVPLVPWNGRVLLRVSVQAYNSPTDIETLISAVARVLEAEQQRSTHGSGRNMP